MLRRLSSTLVLLLVLCSTCWATISVDTVWEVRPTNGADTNGGGFVTGSTGLDYTYGANAPTNSSPKFNGTDLVVSHGSNLVVTSASHNFVANDVGNLIQITAGTGFTTGFYQIVSVASNAATLDRSPGAIDITGGTWAEGGALNTIKKAYDQVPVGASGTRQHIICVKAEAAIPTTATINLTGSTLTGILRILGYTTTRGDEGRVTIQGSTGSGYNLLTLNRATVLENFVLDCNGLTNSGGVVTDSYCVLTNCKVMNYRGTGSGINLNNTAASAYNCEVTGGTGTGFGISISYGYSNVFGCYIHNTSTAGVYIGSNTNGLCVTVANCVITGHTYGIQYRDTVSTGGGYAIQITSNTIDGNTYGLYNTSTNRAFPQQIILKNNIFSNNTTGGIYGSGAGNAPASPLIDGNGYYNNGTNRFNYDGTSGNHAAVPYTNSLDVIATADPYVNRAGGDFRLNNNLNGGRSLRRAGAPRTYPGLSSPRGYPDFGAYQSIPPLNR